MSMVPSDTDMSGTSPGSPSPTARRKPTTNTQWWVLAILAIAQLMVVLDVTIVNIALPSAQVDLGFSNDSRQWVITGYSLAFGGLLIVGGRLGDRFGRRKAFLCGATGFALASLLGGIASTFALLVTARACQGAFGALMAPAALSLLSTTFADSPARSKAFGIWGATAGAGGAIGLLLGGVLTEYLSWRWCLLVNVGFAAVALIGGLIVLPKAQPLNRTTINLPSAATVSLGLFGVVYGLSRAEIQGWADPVTEVSLGIGCVLLVGFVLAQNRLKAPLLPLRVVADRGRGGALIAILLAGAGIFGVFLFLTFYMQQVLQFSAVTTGCAFLPMAISLGLVAVGGARLLATVGPRSLIVVGALCAAVAMVLLVRIDVTSSYTVNVLGPLLLLGVGCGLIFSAASSTATLGLQASDAGVGSALVSTAQQVGGAVGVALLSTQAATVAKNHLSELLGRAHGRPTAVLVQQAGIDGYHAAFAWATGFFLLAAVLCAAVVPHGPARVDQHVESLPPI